MAREQDDRFAELDEIPVPDLQAAIDERVEAGPMMDLSEPPRRRSRVLLAAAAVLALVFGLGVLAVIVRSDDGANADLASVPPTTVAESAFTTPSTATPSTTTTTTTTTTTVPTGTAPEELVLNQDLTLTEDFVGSIVISADGVTLDCDGHAVLGPGRQGNTEGILAQGVRNVTIANCQVEGFTGTGIMLRTVSDSIVSGNSTAGSDEGVSLLERSTGNTISGNSSERNTFDGFLIQDSDMNEIVDNAAGENAADFSFERADSNRVSSNASAGGSKGFEVVAGLGNVFEDNTATDNDEGMIDATTGEGTSGTANEYSANVSRSATNEASSPPGLCE